MAKQSANANQLCDGLIHFQVKQLDGSNPRQLSIDALLLKMTCEEAETAHGYKYPSQPTAAFLADLAKRLQGIGVENCSASIAYQLWHLAGDAIATLKKNTSETPTLPSGSTSRRKGKGRTGK